MLTGPQQRALLCALLFILYLSGCLRIGNVFPFSAFDMFAGRWDRSTRIVASTAAGATMEVRSLRQWHCDRDQSLDDPELACRPEDGHPEKEPRVLSWIASQEASSGRQPAPTAEPVDLVRRTYRIAVSGGLFHRDCVLRRCTAVLQQSPYRVHPMTAPYAEE